MMLIKTILCRNQGAAVEKWFAKEPPVVSFDDRLQFYRKTIEEVQHNISLIKASNTRQSRLHAFHHCSEPR